MPDENHNSLFRLAMAEIRLMHKEMLKIFRDQRRRTFEYVEDFVKEISRLIEKLKIFPYHITWECIDQLSPGYPYVEECYVLRDVTPQTYKKAPLRKDDFPGFFQSEYLNVSLGKNKFRQQFLDFFTNQKIQNVFYVPLEEGYSYINLPIFSSQSRMPQWIFTLIYKEEEIELPHDKEFIDLLAHISQQIGLAWEKFQEIAVAQLLGKIDSRLGGEDKTGFHSTLDQLEIIAELLARKYQTEWCGFFLVDEQKNILKLEAGNVSPITPIVYPLSSHNNALVKCFNNSQKFLLNGRKNLEEIISPEELKQIEKGLRDVKRKETYKAGKNYFTPFILFEHALFIPISFSGKRLGLTVLFSGKNAQVYNPPNKYDFITRPFSQFETYLLEKVQRNVFNIFISHDAVQRRLRDIRRVISPVSEVITLTETALSDRAITSDPRELLLQINNLSRLTTQYVMNFETLLDFDSRKLKIKKEILPDLRKYLIGFARLYTPLIRPKCISINITQQTPDNIIAEVDKELFDLVISNLIDNAVKYSFDPEERNDCNLQAKPKSIEDKENVLITALEEDNSITIAVSSYGPELLDEEKKSIFSRGFRGIHGFDRADGLGVGLFLVKEIVERHNGTIRIESNTPQYNTIFKITLPKNKKKILQNGSDSRINQYRQKENTKRESDYNV